MRNTRLWALLLSMLVAPACSTPTVGSGDAGGGSGDSGSTADSSTNADSGSTTDDGGTAGDDAGGSTDDAGTTGDDGGTTSCMPFRGRYVAVDVQCNGVPYTRMSFITPPLGGWYLQDDGTDASFTQTVMGCSLVANGHIDCDSPVVGQFTHVPEEPLACEPAACTPFASACSGSAVGTQATWTYEVRGDGTVYTETVGDTPIQTCTGAGQSNPVQVTWMLMP